MGHWGQPSCYPELIQDSRPRGILPVESRKGETEYSPECQRCREKPAKPGKADQAHQEQPHDDEQADGMAGPIAATVTAERNNLGRARFFTVRPHQLMILLASPNRKFHTSPHKLLSFAFPVSQRPIVWLRRYTLSRLQVVEQALYFGVAVQAVQLLGHVVVKQVDFRRGGRFRVLHAFLQAVERGAL